MTITDNCLLNAQSSKKQPLDSNQLDNYNIMNTIISHIKKSNTH